MEKAKQFFQLQSGQAFLVTVFIIGIVTVAVSITMATISVSRVGDVISEAKGERAAYAARAGLEEILYRLINDSNFGNGTTETVENNTLDGAVYIATISGNSQERIATATGIIGNHIRKQEVRLTASASAQSIALDYAAQVGEGGLTMHSNSVISAAAGAAGAVYSNGIIQGFDNAKITGTAWAVQGINPSPGSIEITEDAHGAVLQDCVIKGDSYSPVPPVDCNVSGSENVEPAPTPLPLPEVDIAFWQNQAQSGGTINGDYILSSNERNSLGPKEITGNLILNSNAKLTVTGSLWVHGKVVMNSNSQLILDESFGDQGTVILLDHPTDKINQGILKMNSNAEVKKNSEKGYIVFVSTNQSGDCTVKAASFTANAEAPAIVANDGCVEILSNAELVALSAYRVIIAANAEVEYETEIASTLYVPAPGIGGSGGVSGWQISSWKEIP